MTVHIRRAVPSDTAALAALARETFPMACPPELSADDIAQAVAEFFTLENVSGWITSPDAIVNVAEAYDAAEAQDLADPSAQPQLAGYALAYLKAGEAELSKCYVRQDHHGSGYATALLDATITAAQSVGATRMTLGTNQGNARALKFYAKHGFAQVGTRTFQVGAATCHDFVLARQLSEETSVGSFATTSPSN